MVGLPLTHVPSVVSLPSSSVRVRSSGTLSPSLWSNPTLGFGLSWSWARPGARPWAGEVPASSSAQMPARSGRPRRLVKRFDIGPLPFTRMRPVDSSLLLRLGALLGFLLLGTLLRLLLFGLLLVRL